MNVDGMPNINASVDAVLSAIDNTVPLVQEFLKDASFPLEDRWALFLKSETLLPIDGYSDGQLTVIGVDSIYDEFWIERYQTMTYSDLDERLAERFSDAEAVLENPTEYPDTEYSTPVKDARTQLVWKGNYDEWREAVLDAGYGSFTYDW